MPGPVSIKAVVTLPDGTKHRGRFVFHNGTAALWVDNKREKTATRTLFAQNATFVRSNRGSIPHVLTTEAGEEWSLVSRGAGCSSCGSPTKKIPLSKLLDPDYDYAY